MRSYIPSLAVAFALVLSTFAARADNAADALLGTWHTSGDESEVLIFKQNNHYYGKIIRLKEPNWPANSKLGTPGTPKNDRNNPNPLLRNQPIIGLQIMSGFDYAGNRTWLHGSVYDPKSGRTYHGKITMISPNRLELRGYVGVSLFGRTVIWTR